jgi:hypothetical protein
MTMARKLRKNKNDLRIVAAPNFDSHGLSGPLTQPLAGCAQLGRNCYISSVGSELYLILSLYTASAKKKARLCRGRDAPLVITRDCGSEALELYAQTSGNLVFRNRGARRKDVVEMITHVHRQVVGHIIGHACSKAHGHALIARHE